MSILTLLFDPEAQYLGSASAPYEDLPWIVPGPLPKNYQCNPMPVGMGSAWVVFQLPVVPAGLTPGEVINTSGWRGTSNFFVPSGLTTRTLSLFTFQSQIDLADFNGKAGAGFGAPTYGNGSTTNIAGNFANSVGLTTDNLNGSGPQWLTGIYAKTTTGDPSGGDGDYLCGCNTVLIYTGANVTNPSNSEFRGSITAAEANSIPGIISGTPVTAITKCSADRPTGTTQGIFTWNLVNCPPELVFQSTGTQTFQTIDTTPVSNAVDSICDTILTVGAPAGIYTLECIVDMSGGTAATAQCLTLFTILADEPPPVADLTSFFFEA